MNIDQKKLAEALERLRKLTGESAPPSQPAELEVPWENRGEALAAALRIGATGQRMAAGAKLDLPAEWVEQFGSASD